MVDYLDGANIYGMNSNVDLLPVTTNPQHVYPIVDIFSIDAHFLQTHFKLDVNGTKITYHVKINIVIENLNVPVSVISRIVLMNSILSSIILPFINKAKKKVQDLLKYYVIYSKPQNALVILTFIFFKFVNNKSLQLNDDIVYLH